MDFSPFVREIAAALGQTISCVVRTEWGSAHPNHRETIRAAAAHELGARLTTGDQESLRDLQRVPQLAGAALSISHCRDAGGFAWSDGRILGFDLENADRVEERSLARVSSFEEMTAAQAAGAGATLVWAAKEAGFKALPEAQQPQVIGQVHAHSWSAHGHGFVFRISVEDSTGMRELCEGRGYVAPVGSVVAAVFAG